ncbi:MAG: serine/threonine protein kinase [Deltaproteobacteria bacterium]|nr:serine/threonine protein kinase [Deltaproteobacteria bacterium]
MVEAASLVGQTIAGKYVIEELIGSGGMAWVYRASTLEGRYEVALKLLNPDLAAQDPDVIRRFRHEAKAASRIDHPNAVRIVDYGIDGRSAYIAMELLVGRDLATIAEQESPLDPWRAVDLVAQVCDVLAAAHREGILHRDLKPENVIVLGEPPGEHVKVLDFGLAKIYSKRPGGEEFTGTQMGAATVVGTPEYMSPEQCKGGKLDQRSDVYSVGVLLYYLLTGRVPFCGINNVDTMLRHVKDPPYQPSLLVPRLPEAVEKAVLKALAKEPSSRFQTARHFQEALIKMAFDAGREASSPPQAPSRPPDSGQILPPPMTRASMPSISEEEAALAAQVRVAMPQEPAIPPFAPAAPAPAASPPAATAPAAGPMTAPNAPHPMQPPRKPARPGGEPILLWIVVAVVVLAALAVAALVVLKR